MKLTRKLLSAFIVTIVVFSMMIPAQVLAAGATVKMVDMHDLGLSDAYVVTDEITDSYGKTYNSNVLRLESGKWADISYDLNGAYEKFDATIVCPNDAGSDANIDVAFFGDGVLLSEISGYSRQKPANSFSVDVSGVGLFEIRTHGTDYWHSPICFVNSSFTKCDNPVIYPNRTKLADLVVIDSQNTDRSTGLLIDNLGDFYDGWVKFDAGRDNCYALFNLEKSYETLTGCIVASDDMASDASSSFIFYLDDNEVLRKENVTRTSQIDFEINVENASVLKIVASGTNYWYSTSYVANPFLKSHEHTVGEWETTVEASCTEEGEKVQKCIACGEVVNTEKIPALGHKSDGKSVVTKEATCTEPGEEAQHCTVCGEPVEVKAIAALGHTPDGKWTVTKEATCAEEGEEVQHCTVCGEVAESRPIEKTAHTPSKDWETVREATCAAEGLRQKICTVCGEVAEEEVIEKTDHKFGSWTTLSGSVWNNPIVKERTCSVCGEVEHVESNSTSWLKPLVIVLFLIVFGGLAVILVTLKMNGLPLEPASVKKLFSKETLSDTDIENLLNKKEDTEHKE